MDTLSLTLTNTRVIDGLIFAANTAGLTPEAYAEWLLTQNGHRYADANSYGVITSAAFFARFSPTEYTDVLTAAADRVVVPDPIGNPIAPDNKAEIDAAVAQNADADEIQALVDELTNAERVALDDQRVTDGLSLLVSRGLLGVDRPAVITSYERPTVGGV